MFRFTLYVACILVLAYGFGYVIATAYHEAIDATRRLDEMSGTGEGR